MDAIEELVSESPTPISVTVMGALTLSETLEEVVSHHIFAFASTDESFAMAPVEAAASGVPCVTTRVGALPEELPAPSTVWWAGGAKEFCTALMAAQRDWASLESAAEKEAHRIRSSHTTSRANGERLARFLRLAPSTGT